MTEQTTTRIYLGRFDGDRLAEVTHFTSLDDRCVPSSIATLVAPRRGPYIDWHGNVWHELTEGRVTEQRADNGGACCWCEFPEARQKYLPVPASAAVGGVHMRPLRREPQFWATLAVTGLVGAVLVWLVIAAVTA